MRIPGRKLARTSSRWLRSRFGPRAVVLGYHRITDASPDPYEMHVSPSHFAEQLEALHDSATPLRLGDLTPASGGSIPRGAVVLTFDDGYAHQLSRTKELLERFEIPMTFFVTTGALGEEFWWDELERILRFAERLPDQLSLRMNSAKLEWRARDPGDAAGREPLLRTVSRWLEPLDPASRKQALEELRSWAGPGDRPEPAHRAVTTEELLELAAGGLVEIGAHSVTHPRLAGLPRDEQRDEIETSGKQLRELLDREVHSFSYPHGSVSRDTVELVRGAGYRRACTSDPYVVSRRTDPLLVPRFWVPDCDGDAFTRWLRRWL